MTNNNGEWTWINLRVPRDGPEVAAVEHIKRVHHYRTTTDAVSAAIIEYARMLGWQEETCEVSETSQV